MIIHLKNEQLCVDILSTGAELLSIREVSDGLEYFYQSENPHYPTILFPNLTAIKDGYIIVGGKEYPLMHAGFAKSEEFSVEKSSETEAVLVLQETEKSLAVFPYRFMLRVTYTLNGRTLSVSAQVGNPDSEKALYYSLGFHPGYRFPTGEERYKIEFESLMTADRYIRAEKLFTTEIQNEYLKDVRELPLTETLFEDGTLALTDLTSGKLKVQGELTGRMVSVDMGDYPNLAVFAPADRQLSFACIEMWDGAPDRDDTNHVWEEKPDLRRLAPGEKSTREFAVTFDRGTANSVN